MRFLALLPPLLLFVGLLPSPAVAETTPVRTLSFCFDERGAPSWFGADGRGEAIARLDAVAAAQGLRFDYRGMNEEDCQLAAANGRVDGIVGVAHRADLQWAVAFPPEAPGDTRRALFVEGTVLVRRLGAPIDIVDGSLVGLRTPLAVVAGSEAAREFRALGLRVDDRHRHPRALLERVARLPAGAAALGWGEARALLAEDAELAGRLQIVPKPLRPRAHYLVFSKPFMLAEPALAETLWSALAQAPSVAPASP